MLNTKGSAAAAAAGHHLSHHIAQAFSAPPTTSETGSEFESVSDHSSEFSSRSARPMQPLPYMQSPIHQVSQSDIQQTMPLLASGYGAPRNGQENGYRLAPNPSEHQPHAGQPFAAATSGGGEAAKAFACTSCGKGFARRSDLARHGKIKCLGYHVSADNRSVERIHSGVRPHVCEHPGCGKQFIQRSALTVHARVHTGEKPHMCERCGKVSRNNGKSRLLMLIVIQPFSDSSSLARHRRIHSGKRPYKCPYADCQKTFTRRTTLTRHQNHHTGTVEEAAAATAAALATRPPNLTQQTSSEGGNYSDSASNASTPSPGQRELSLSPSSEMPRIPSMSSMNRQNTESFVPSGSLPHHLRYDLQPPSLRSSPSISSPTLSSYGAPPPSSGQHRPSLTSHPAMYGPPPVLEPPTHPEHRHSGSSGSSPHLGSVGWQSPIPSIGGSPVRDSYAYPEPPFAQPANHLYYPNSNMRQPQSTEPDQYETKPRMVGGEVWAGPM